MLRSFRPSLTVVAIIATLVVAIQGDGVFAGHNVFNNNSVGGIAIDPAGVVGEAKPEATKVLLENLQKSTQAPAAEMNQPVEMRKISLRRLEAAIQDAMANNFGQLPEEIRYLAGLQRIQYILVYPDQHDIVLAGPGEGWRVDERANVVGVTTGRPVMRLDDLLVALRSVHAAQEQSISCSIDPTPEGVERFMATVNKVQSATRNNRIVPEQAEPALKEAMGPQNITISGVPTNTHFARVMVAADYHMKRLAMDIGSSPTDMPSYLDLLSRSTDKSARPRWWLACNYDNLARSEDGFVWELRGQGVKALTEENALAAGGKVEARRGETSPMAQKWADLMTERYDELSAKIAVFGELRNLMDMCVLAAIIEMNGLRNEAGCELTSLYDSNGPVPTETWNSPKTIDTVCSFVRTRKSMLVTASGGVQIESWDVAKKAQAEADLAEIRKVAGTGGESWWWN